MVADLDQSDLIALIGDQRYDVIVCADVLEHLKAPDKLLAQCKALLNPGGSVHGGAIMTFIDMALFAGGKFGGQLPGHFVTLDCATHFIARTMAGSPLDAFVRVVGQTKGGMVFLSGHCEQDGVTTHSFTGTLKKIRDRT